MKKNATLIWWGMNQDETVLNLVYAIGGTLYTSFSLPKLPNGLWQEHQVPQMIGPVDQRHQLQKRYSLTYRNSTKGKATRARCQKAYFKTPQGAAALKRAKMRYYLKMKGI